MNVSQTFQATIRLPHIICSRSRLNEAPDQEMEQLEKKHKHKHRHKDSSDGEKRSHKHKHKHKKHKHSSKEDQGDDESKHEKRSLNNSETVEVTKNKRARYEQSSLEELEQARAVLREQLQKESPTVLQPTFTNGTSIALIAKGYESDSEEEGEIEHGRAKVSSVVKPVSGDSVEKPEETTDSKKKQTSDSEHKQDKDESKGYDSKKQNSESLKRDRSENGEKRSADKLSESSRRRDRSTSEGTSRHDSKKVTE